LKVWCVDNFTITEVIGMSTGIDKKSYTGTQKNNRGTRFLGPKRSY